MGSVNLRLERWWLGDGHGCRRLGTCENIPHGIVRPRLRPPSGSLRCLLPCRVVTRNDVRSFQDHCSPISPVLLFVIALRTLVLRLGFIGQGLFVVSVSQYSAAIKPHILLRRANLFRWDFLLLCEQVNCLSQVSTTLYFGSSLFSSHMPHRT